MRLLIIGALEGQLTQATKLAMDGGAKVAHAATVDIAMATLRAGRGADLLLVDVMSDIPGLIAALDAERFSIPVVACGTESNAAAAVNAIRAGAKEYIPLPPDEELPEGRLPPDMWVHLCVVDEPDLPDGFGDAVADTDVVEAVE